MIVEKNNIIWLEITDLGEQKNLNSNLLKLFNRNI